MMHIANSAPGKLYIIPVLLHHDAEVDTLSGSIIETIRNISCFAVENIRSARRFISRLKLSIEIDRLEFHVLDKNTGTEALNHVTKRLIEGESIGLMSEAGCPGVADPGHVLVRWAHQNRIEVVPLVGPSSIVLTVMASGLNGQMFTFHGYLPIDADQRKKKLQMLEHESAKTHYAQLFIETPYRNQRLLEDILSTLRAETQLCLGVDLTAPNGYIRTQSIKKWQKSPPTLHKRQVLFMLQA